MSAAKKKVPYQYPKKDAADTQENLRNIKIEAEKVREKLHKSIIDNPAAAKKAALILSLWIQGKDKKKKR
jgi:hypothetical protein